MNEGATVLSHDTTLEQDTYRVVLVRSGSCMLWTSREKGAFPLPRVAIPRWRRPAEQLQQAIEAGWHLRAIVLDVLSKGSDSTPCAVVEILSPEPQGNLIPVSIDDVLEEEMTSEEREVIKVIISGDVRSRGPFSRLGWVDEALEWMQEVVGRSIRFTGEVRQYNASGSFALARFATQTGPRFWLKATGEPNVHEFSISKMLAQTSPEFLPRRIAERRDWNAWLMEDAGDPLDFWTMPALERAVSSMALLQRGTIGRTSAFLAAGAFDQRVSVLVSHLAELVEYLDEAMAKQVSAKVPRIGKRRLLQIASIVEDACCRMEALDIPDTLVHNDMNLGNVLFRGTSCVFTDWCETGVGNPFLGFERLCLLRLGSGEDCGSQLRESYRQGWLHCLSSTQIEAAFLLAPIVAILAFLYGRGAWLHTPRQNPAYAESYVRALARHLDRAAQDSRLLEVLCH
ncbi:MAG TPA: hypothetical protein VGI45_24210 [Terracidiphilus sp.]